MRRKRLCLAVAAVFFAAMLCFCLHLVCHTCADGDCPVCRIALAAKSFALPSPALYLALAALAQTCLVQRGKRAGLFFPLVSQFVQMND